MSEPRLIWYSPEHRTWWMHPTDPREAIRIVQQYEDAINVTNAYTVLPAEFVERLRAGQVVTL